MTSVTELERKQILPESKMSNSNKIFTLRLTVALDLLCLFTVYNIFFKHVLNIIINLVRFSHFRFIIYFCVKKKKV